MIGKLAPIGKQESSDDNASFQLTDIAVEINRHHQDATKFAKSALHSAKQCGELLLQAKSQCRHGEWLPWLESNCDVSIRQAQRYMKVAESWQAITKNDAASYLTIDDAIAAISENPESTLRDAQAAFPEITGVHDSLSYVRLCNATEQSLINRSVLTIGLNHEILLTKEGVLIDGRARLIACYKTGVEPRFRRISTDPWQVCYAENIARGSMSQADIAAFQNLQDPSPSCSSDTKEGSR